MQSQSYNSRFKKNQVLALPAGLEIKRPFMFPEQHYVQGLTHNVTEARFNHGEPADSLDGRLVLITGLQPVELGLSVPLRDLFLYSAVLAKRHDGLWTSETDQRQLIIEGPLLQKARLLGQLKPQGVPNRAAQTFTPVQAKRNFG